MKLNLNMKTLWGKLLVVGFALWACGLAAQPVITLQSTNVVVLNGSNVNLSVTVSGTGPFIYRWMFNGTNLPFAKIINTIAGITSGYVIDGEGVPATNVSVSYPQGVLMDHSGNVFISPQEGRAKIRKVDTNGIITTIAGYGLAGFSGDGGSATNAQISNNVGVLLAGMAFDGQGNFYFSDTGNFRVRKIDTNGIITTVAGKGSPPYSGDGGAATNAGFSYPNGIVFDKQGNLYIADIYSNRIRKVDTNGIITTFAGTGSTTFAGDGGPASSAGLYYPMGLSFDNAGNLYIADSVHGRIRKVNTNGIISTIVSGLLNPFKTVPDAFGNLYIAENSGISRVYQLDANGVLSTLVGTNVAGFSGDGGLAINAQIAGPTDLALNEYGQLLIADSGNSRVRKVDLAGSPIFGISSVSTNNAGNYQVVATSLSGSVTSSVAIVTVVFPPAISAQPQSQAVTNGWPANFSVIASGTGAMAYQWYFNNSILNDATNPILNFPATDATQGGNYFCVMTNNYGCLTSSIVSLTVLMPPGILTLSSNQVALYGTNIALNVNVTGTGPFTYQWQQNGTNLPNKNNIITRVVGIPNLNGFSGDGGLAIAATTGGKISGVLLDEAGNLFVVDQVNNRIRKVDTNGIINTVVTNLTLNAGVPAGIAMDLTGNIYIGETGNNQIRKVDTNGVMTIFAGTNSSGFSGDGGLAIVAKLSSPSGVAVDTNGNVFFADTGNNRIRRVDVNGIITTVAGTNASGFYGDGGPATNAKLASPYGIAVDSGGNLFIADKSNHRIRKVDVYGIISTVAGTGTASYGGDGGPAPNALLNLPYGVAVDSFGDVYVADYGNNRVRMFGVNGLISTVAGNGTAGISGDGGIATNATLYNPTSLGVDGYGNAFVGGSTFGTVRKIDLGRIPTWQLNNLNAGNAGDYDVIVSSPYGSVTSSIVSLTVHTPPGITTQPISSRVVAGSTTNLSVVISSIAPFGYQWFTSSGRTATATPIISFGQILHVSVNDQGMGYISTPQVRFVGGIGSGATASAILGSGVVLSINLNNGGGSGYSSSSPPTVQIDPPPITATLLPSQTNAMLTLPSVTGTDGTNYFVVITNSYGSVTSSIVSLWVFVQPQNFSAGKVVATNGGQISLQLSGTPNYPYIVQSTTNLAPPISWKSIRTNYADTNGNWSFTVTNLPASPNLFYRAVGQ